MTTISDDIAVQTRTALLGIAAAINKAFSADSPAVDRAIATGKTDAEVQKASAPAPAAAAEPDEIPTDETDKQKRTRLMKTDVRTLRKLLIDGHEEPADKIRAITKKSELVDMLIKLDTITGNEYEADDKDDEDEEGGEVTREDLEKLSLRELKSMATDPDQGNIDPAKLKGLDAAAVINLLLGATGTEGLADDEEEEEEVAAETEEEEEEDDDEGVDIDPDEVEEMGLAELVALAGQIGLEVEGKKAGALRKEILDLVAEAE